MVSVTSVTGKYILQPALMSMHKRTLEWLSTAAFWKKELVFFQKLLDQYASGSFDYQKQKTIEHLQSMITYYQYELIDALTSGLRLHEKKLAEMLETGMRQKRNTSRSTMALWISLNRPASSSITTRRNCSRLLKRKCSEITSPGPLRISKTDLVCNSVYCQTHC